MSLSENRRSLWSLKVVVTQKVVHKKTKLFFLFNVLLQTANNTMICGFGLGFGSCLLNAAIVLGREKLLYFLQSWSLFFSTLVLFPQIFTNLVPKCHLLMRTPSLIHEQNKQPLFDPWKDLSLTYLLSWEHGFCP